MVAFKLTVLLKALNARKETQLKLYIYINSFLLNTTKTETLKDKEEESLMIT